jgi:hypothetical protein
VDIELQVILVRETEESKNRVVMLSRSLAPALWHEMLAANSLRGCHRQVQRDA